MEQDTKEIKIESQPKQAFVLTTPIALIIVGVLIAGAILIKSPSGTVDTKTKSCRRGDLSPIIEPIRILIFWVLKEKRRTSLADSLQENELYTVFSCETVIKNRRLLLRSTQS